ISQLFSNADGSVQYIQLYERAGKNGQNQFAGVTITVSSGDVVRTFVVPGNLPSSRTATRPVLIGTASLADGSSGYGPIAPGFTRTYQDFAAYDSAFAFVPEAVCRFRIPPEQGDSHFFSASPSECADVRAKFPSFTEETTAAFYAALPDPDSGACSGGLIPLYRVWNQRTDSNHRYVTDRRVRDQMVAARGYVAE